MSLSIIIVAVLAIVAAVLIVSKMRKNKGAISLLLDKTHLDYGEIISGNIQLSLKQQSDTEELNVTLKCVERITYKKEGEDTNISKTIYENTTRLCGHVTHPAGYEQTFPVEFQLPNDVETTDLNEFYEPSESHIAYPHRQAYDRYGQAIMPLDYPSSELTWRINTQLKTTGLDLHDTQSLTVKPREIGPSIFQHGRRNAIS